MCRLGKHVLQSLQVPTWVMWLLMLSLRMQPTHSSPCSQQNTRQGLNTLLQDQAPKIMLATNVQHSVLSTI